MYWSIDGEYRIHLTRCERGVGDSLKLIFLPVSQPRLINYIFTTNIPILYM